MGRGSSLMSRRAGGDGTRSTTASSRRPTPKLVSAEPKKTGESSPDSNFLRSKTRSTASSNSTPSSASVASALSMSAGLSIGLTSSGAMVEPCATRVNCTYSLRSRSITPSNVVDSPTGQVTGAGSRIKSRSISSRRSHGSRPGRSHLLMNVTMGTSRSRQTSNNRRVCGSMPLPASSTMMAASVAARTRNVSSLKSL